MHVSECCLIKPLSVTKDASIVDAAKILRDAKQRRVIVVDGKGQPVGIISTTDMNNRVVAEGKDAASLKASDIMTAPLHVVCTMDCDVRETFEKMVSHETFFVPVMKDEKLYGIVTYGELVQRMKRQVLHG